MIVSAMNNLSKIILSILLVVVVAMGGVVIGLKYLPSGQQTSKISQRQPLVTPPVSLKIKPSVVPTITPTIIPENSPLIFPLGKAEYGLIKIGPEIEGWLELDGKVINVDKEARKITVGNPPTFSREIAIPNDAVIVEGAKDEKGEIVKLPKTFEDLIPGETRVSILISTLCPTPKVPSGASPESVKQTMDNLPGETCEKARIVNIIGEK